MKEKANATPRDSSHAPCWSSSVRSRRTTRRMGTKEDVAALGSVEVFGDEAHVSSCALLIGSPLH